MVRVLKQFSWDSLDPDAIGVTTYDPMVRVLKRSIMPLPPAFAFQLQPTTRW